MSQDFIDWFRNCPVEQNWEHANCESSLWNPETWPLLASLEYPIILVLSYFLIGFLLGPWLMMNKEAWNLFSFTEIYNSFLGLSFFIIGSLLIYCMLDSNYSIWCQPIIVQRHCCGSVEAESVKVPEDMVAMLIGAFHVLKVIQLGEASILILEQRRVSLVYAAHHASIAVLSWAGVIFAPGGTTAIMVTTSCFSFPIIVIFGKLRTNTWPTYNQFASYVQIIQFTFIGILAAVAYYMDCNYPTWASIAVLIFIAKFSLMVIEELCWADGVFSAHISLKQTGFGAPWFQQHDPIEQNYVKKR